MKRAKQYRLQNNTDSVDIDAKCLGVSAWQVGDSTNQLNTARGLHIQIRHNRDKATFEAANDIARLISAAPEMLEALSELIKFTEYAVGVLEAPDKCSIRENLAKAIAIVAKARGES